MSGKRGGYSPPWTDENVQFLRDNYATMTAPQIAEKIGRTCIAVHVRAHLEGLKSLHRTGVNSLIPGYFRVIDTPVKAYLLGLLVADGSMSKAGQLKLELHEKDACLVELARDEIAPGARIGHYRTRTTPMVRFMVSAPDLVADLASHGVVNAKSLITRWPDDVPPKLESSYMCGYFDGDGSLRAEPPYRWTVVSGNPDFLEVMQDRIKTHTGVKVGGPYRDTRHKAAWSIVATGKPVQALDAWLHHDVPGLARKRLPQPSQMELDITG